MFEVFLLPFSSLMIHFHILDRKRKNDNIRLITNWHFFTVIVEYHENSDEPSLWKFMQVVNVIVLRHRVSHSIKGSDNQFVCIVILFPFFTSCCFTAWISQRQKDRRKNQKRLSVRSNFQSLQSSKKNFSSEYDFISKNMIAHYKYCASYKIQ